MKKIILSLLAIGFLASANAQQGSILLYGDLGFSSEKDAVENKTIIWSANPGVGYQFNENWTVGINVSWAQHSTSDAPGSSDMTTQNNGRFGAFARYRKTFGKGPFYYYGHAGLGIHQGYTTDADQPGALKHNGIYFEAYPAIGMWIGCNWGINLSFGGIGYSTDKYTTDASGNSVSNANTSSDLGITFGSTVHIGASVNLGCGHHGKKHEKKAKKEEKSTEDDE